MFIMAIYAATCIRFVRMKTLVLLGLSTLLLGCGIRLVSLRCIRWWTLAILITFRLWVFFTFPLVPFLGFRGIGYTLLSIP